jgi:hypothetical protein
MTTITLPDGRTHSIKGLYLEAIRSNRSNGSAYYHLGAALGAAEVVTRARESERASMDEDSGVVAAHVGVRDAALRFAQFLGVSEKYRSSIVYETVGSGRSDPLLFFLWC